MTETTRRKVLTTIIATAGLLMLLPTTSSAWAPAGKAKIHPGVMTFTKGAQCTSNFIFKRNGNTYIGQAAHCSGTGSANETNGCDAGSLPLGTKVRVEGARRKGKIVYSSWIAMQRADETNGEACDYNDFALIKLRQRDVKRVNPSIPVFGGPEGKGGAGFGDTVYTYGNSSIRGGQSELSPKQGRVVDRSPKGWSYDVYTQTPGIPGDSGSAFLNESGRALGTLSTVAIAPLPGSNGVSSLVKELGYARNHGMSGLRVIDGTRNFNP